MGTDKDQLFENYIHIKEFAELIGKSPKTVQNWVSNGDIPHIKVGSSIMFKKTSVAAWLAAKEKKKNGKTRKL